MCFAGVGVGVSAGNDFAAEGGVFSAFERAFAVLGFGVATSGMAFITRGDSSG